MSVTISITVSPTGEAEVRTGADVTGEAPPPAIVGGLEGAATREAAEEAAGPPPLRLEELGLGAAAEIGELTGGPPPEDVETASEEAGATTEAPQPRPIEELE
jgi:hypothetical protein